MNTTQIDRLRRLVEEAKTRHADEESALRNQEMQNIQPWAIRYFSQELGDILGWTPQWDAQEQIAYLAFTVTGDDGKQRSFHLYPINLRPIPNLERFKGHIGLLVTQDSPKQEAVVDDKDIFVLELGRILAL